MKRIHIDTMAPYGVTSTPSAIVRVQEIHPNINLTGVYHNREYVVDS